MAVNTDISLRNKVICSVYVRNHTEEGTLNALREDLDRIKELGTDIIWLMPIHPIGVDGKKGTLGCPYSVSDYRKVNPCYGTIEDFTGLVDRIHELGMKCIIDVVYNHTSRDSVLSKTHSEYFYHDDEGNFGNRAGDWSDVIDLDYGNDDLWDYQIETLKYWAGIVDGFRCDVASMIPMDFWKRAREECAKVKENLIWLAESIEIDFIKYLRSIHLTAASDNEIYEAFDIAYDYDIWRFYKGYLTGEVNASNYAAVLDMQDGIYPDNYIKLRALENHDQQRVMDLVRDINSVKRLLAFSYFQKGTALIYAGEEFGDDKVPSLFEKDIVNRKTGFDISSFLSKLHEIKQHKIFSEGTYHVKAVPKTDIFVAEYNHGDNYAVGIFDIRGQAYDTRVNLRDGKYINLINGNEITVKDKHISARDIYNNDGVIEIII